MNGRAITMIIVPVIIMTVASFICGHIASTQGIMTGGLTIMAAPPSSGWDVIVSAIAFYGGALTFNVTGMLWLSVFFWILNMCVALGILMAVKGSN
jgi:hypothetical protein